MKKFLIVVLLCTLAVAANSPNRFDTLYGQAVSVPGMGVASQIVAFHDNDSGIEFICNYTKAEMKDQLRYGDTALHDKVALSTSVSVSQSVSCFPTGRKWGEKPR